MNQWIFGALGVVIGAAVAWIVALVRFRQTERRTSAAEAEAGMLRRQQDVERQETLKLREKLEGEQKARVIAETSLDAERKNLDQQHRLLNEAQLKLAETFKALSGDVLASQSQSFLQLADQKFGMLRAEAEGALLARQQAIESLVAPLGDSLKSYGEMIHQMEKARAEAYGGLASELKNLLVASESLQRETGNLTAALKGGSQVRGRWGELTLRRVVELAGMSEHCDFKEQESLQDEAGRFRPDLIVNLPGERRIAIDAKAPLQPFLDAVGASSDLERRAALENYARVVRTHMNQLGGKAYWEQLQPSPELVVLFLPGESFFSAALEQDRSLIEDAMQKRVVIATPTTLIALLHAVAYGWRQEQVEKSAQQVGDLGRQLYDRLRVFVGHFADAGTALRRAVDGYNRAAGSFESRVLTAARKFKELGAVVGDDIVELPALDEMPRAVRSTEPPPDGIPVESTSSAAPPVTGGEEECP
ncbi:MAG TPA: DNA recombination protein RmuC [Terriglobia bacterium]|nr:DNA recombination protein RmuC [Terriglobia bacterium]